MVRHVGKDTNLLAPRRKVARLLTTVSRQVLNPKVTSLLKRKYSAQSAKDLVVVTVTTKDIISKNTLRKRMARW